jgi:primosomal protein N' (replication factor Y)
MLIDVSVLVSKAPSLLTYAVPVSLQGRPLLGCRVVVPMAGRRVTGVVVAPRDVAPEGVKPSLIADILDDTPVVDARQLALAHFVARYYEAPLQDALRLVLPPDTLTAPKRRFRLTERGERARVFFQSEGLNAADVALLQSLESGVVVDAGRLKRLGGTRPRILKFLERGLLEELTATRPVTAVKRVEHLVPLEANAAVDVATDDAGDAPALLPIPKAAVAVAALDAWVRAFAKREGRPPTMPEADVAVGRARAKVNKLVALGRLRVDAVTRDVGRVRRVSGKGAADALSAHQRVAVDAIVGALRTKQTVPDDDDVDDVDDVDHDDAGDTADVVDDVSAPSVDPFQRAFLLEGVTGSGKTEVYLAALAQCLARGMPALLIVPEIALTPQLVARVEAAVPETVVVLHSGLSDADRRDGLQLLRDGAARVVVGARSAVFAPTLKPLGLIIVDEEHESSLKQDESAPRYHAKDVALWRAHSEGAVAVLGSATPSLESRHNVATGKLTRLHLPERHGGGGALPIVDIIDLKLRKTAKIAKKRDRAVADDHGGVVLSGPLVEAMAQTLADKAQVLLFLNRRGWSSTITCDCCGKMRMCPQCAVPLTLHRADQQRSPHLRCHQCGFAEPFVGPLPDAPPLCPECHEDGLVQLGTGTERVEAEVRARFPDARIARLDRDAQKSHDDVETTLASIQRGDVDVIIGTQMVAKGHDWPAVALVGVVLADIAMAIPDFRASERAMSLLTQVAGRAGRGEKRGRVMIQTYDPSHVALKYIVEQDVAAFAKDELVIRENHHYPPYTRLARIRVEHERDSVAFDVANDVRAAVASAGEKLNTWWRVLGPAPCAIERLQGRVRIQLLVFCADATSRSRVLAPLRADGRVMRDAARAGARVVVDVDPMQLN